MDGVRFELKAEVNSLMDTPFHFSRGVTLLWYKVKYLFILHVDLVYRLKTLFSVGLCRVILLYGLSNAGCFILNFFHVVFHDDFEAPGQLRFSSGS